MKNILETIRDTKVEEVKQLKRDYALSRFEDSPFWSKPKSDVFNQLGNNTERLTLIAEVKKASPSKGIIREDFDPLKIADNYANAGVDAISVLTDKNYFQGDIKYLFSLAERFDLPFLRKDFLIDEYQIYEAKSNGADIILLISELLSSVQIDELTSAAHELGMEVLLEMHDDSQVNKINFNKNKLIGINNRNLKNFEVNVLNSARMADRLKSEYSDIVIIGESGFNSKDDIKNVINSGISGLLAGEFFMKQKNIYDAVKSFMEWCYYES